MTARRADSAEQARGAGEVGIFFALSTLFDSIGREGRMDNDAVGSRSLLRGYHLMEPCTRTEGMDGWDRTTVGLQ